MSASSGRRGTLGGASIMSSMRGALFFAAGVAASVAACSSGGRAATVGAAGSAHSGASGAGGANGPSASGRTATGAGKGAGGATATGASDRVGGSGAGGASSAAGSGGAGGERAGAGSGGANGMGATGGSPASVEPASSACQPLPLPTGATIDVSPSDADALPEMVRSAAAGTTFLLADGVYKMSGADEGSRRIQIVSDGVVLRSKSGKRDAVMIDGEYKTEEVIAISASHVTLADISLSHAVNHPVHVMGAQNADITDTLLHDLHILDGGEQFVKINTSGATPNTYADHGVVECSLFEMTDAGRPHVVPDPGGCYTGGIDGHQARGWTIRQNTFTGIHCENGSLAEHAIHFWTSSRDTLVEQNTIIDCARGIGFGLGDGGGNPPDRIYADDPYPGVGYVGHYDGIIRNNMIAISAGFAYFDTGIELEQARGAKVFHNTAIHPTTAFASISYRFANTQVELENNLVRNIRARDGATATGSSSLENAPDALFVDVAGDDLHLLPSAAAAIDKGVVLTDAGNDIDGMPHTNGAPDLGADELGKP